MNSNWADLKRHDDPVAKFLAAIRSGDLKSAQDELQHSPDMVRESIHVACSLGDAEAVRYHLDRHPALRAAEEDGWQPLLYVCGSPFNRLGLRHAFGLHDCAKLLLDRGADVDAFSLADPSDPESKITARVRAMLNNNRFVLLLLAQRGASGDPHTAQAIINRARTGEDASSPSILDYLSDMGFREELNRRLAPIRARRPKKVPALAEMSIKEIMMMESDDDGEARDTNLILFRLAFERGADPNRLGGSNKETALHMSAKMGADGAAIAELFLEHGADPDLADADGQTPYAVAIREGNTAVADMLLAHGAVAGSASPADQFIGACRRVDSGAARSILRSQPDLLQSIRSERGQLLDHAVIRNELKAVKLMAELGLDLAAMSERGASPLHLAAWFGHQELVRFLVDYHAPVNLRDAVYRTSPLAWAAHGSRSSKNWREADDDYCAIVETLIDAGAEYQAACNSWGAGPAQSASDRVGALLKARGF